ncbi:hypothetical protein A1O3_03520 [Capronia epimyces CBS 606.96]|uniref:Acyltransferase 3 domain-containing protein n=1 Tax=Capronia epimyces CBS 606.96 TaxID=1182542 RepID=W9Y178_9EURO|nr:uncharacterized protein A1O3_03520 [Capronia epimyces CBS 606.96]EXJ86567.1 hypothetical protein A1O3_03520 [Capronia epimyces CBS 606.96]
MGSTSSGSSRPSTDDSQVGLLNEKHDFYPDEEISQGAAWLLKPRKFLVPPACLPFRFLVRSITQLFHLFLPSFIQPRHQHGQPKTDKPSPTAFLDGMRGLAAFVVFICHLTYGTFDIGHAWGATPDADSETQHGNWNKAFLRLPVVRLLYSGPPMVAIFFVVSGYALSYKPLKLMRARHTEQLMNTMSSSVFRRALRLFLPCFASTFLVACLAQLSLYKRTETFAAQMRTLREDHCYTQPNPWLQFTDWMQQMLIFVNVFDWSLYAGSVELDRHLWTIPAEFRCSMALFLTQIMVARMSTRLRISTLTALMVWGVSWDRWELWPFWAGMAIAELDMIQTSRTADLTCLTPATPPQQSRLFSKIAYSATFLLSLFLLSYPDAAGHATPGFITLTHLIPPHFTQMHRFWPTVGAILIVWSTCRLGFLREKVFCWSIMQYLGKISFPLYVMHGPVIHTLGYSVSAPLNTQKVQPCIRPLQMGGDSLSTATSFAPPKLEIWLIC